MLNFIFIMTLLSNLCWISVSVCQFHTISVQPAQNVTLLCTNFSKFFSHVWWFKINSSPNSSRISSMSSAESNVTLHNEFNFGKYDMTSNTTNIFLKIKEVNFSHSGLYVCGPYLEEIPQIFTATYLQVEDGLPSLPCIVLGCIAVLLIVVIIALAVEVRTIQTGPAEQKNPQPTQNLDPDGLNYAALNIRPKAKTQRTAENKKESAANVLYAATRQSR